MATRLRVKIGILAALFVSLTLIQVINVQLDGGLIQYGIVPRAVDRWYHVFFAPFIHTSFGHLLNNMIGLSVFSALCLMRSIRFYLGCSLFIIVIGGSLSWVFGRSAIHVGASGWLFGLWSLSIALGWFDRRFVNICLAVLVLLAYGGMVYGLLPADPRISFEMHVFGAVAGVLCAFGYAVLAKRRRR